MDLSEVLALVSLNAAIDSILGLVIALIVVARVVRRQWTSWLDSPEALPYFQKAAEQVMVKMEPRISGLEEELRIPVQIDWAPIVEAIRGPVVEEVANIRAAIDGKIGWFKKVGKGIGEAVSDVAGDRVLEEAGVGEDDRAMLSELDALLLDREWAKEHPAAAFGLRLLKKQLGSSGGGMPSLTRGGPYKPGLPGK